MYLITKWFGVFLLTENGGVEKKILFPKDHKEIKTKLEQIDKGEILAEENKIVKKVDSLLVFEKRLNVLGEYQKNDDFLKKLDLKASDYSFDEDLLREALFLNYEHKMEKKLGADDLQVIQMVDALDDLKQTRNLLLERIDACREISCDKKKIKPVTDSFKMIEEQTVNLEEKIKVEMEEIAPNISTVAGPLIAARLLSQAGSLKKLAFLPSSTIQVLGAEKALFRFKKEGGKPPKHGVIFQNPNISHAPKNKRGKISRVLASKISIAAKADAFTKNRISDDLEEQFKQRKKEIL